MEPMHLAVVTETYAPEINGVAATLAQLVEGLAARRHRLSLVRPDQPGLGLLAQQQHLGPAEMLGLPSWPLPRYPGLRMGRPCVATLKRHWSTPGRRPQLVHIATEGPLGWSALRAAQALHIPVTADFRTNFHTYTSHYGAAWLAWPVLAYLRWFHNHCAATMVPTQALAHELGRRGFDRLHVVARGVATDRFAPERRSHTLRQAWGVDEHTPVLLSVGRLAPEKNLSLLLRAHRALGRQGLAAKLVFVGDGPARAALQAACPDAVFAGMQQGLALAEHYASADLFAFPSLSETFGNVVLEALASGLPVLAYDCAAAATALRTAGPQRNGWLAPVGDEQAFVANAVAALQTLRSPPAALALRTQARQAACARGWPFVVGQAERLLQQVLARSLVPPPPQVNTRGHAALP
jgi:glycosyltransferase involved in cell wall biosynthesis